METSIPRKTPLVRGETLRMPAERGATVLVLDGRVALRTVPEWLAEHVLAPRLILCAGETQPVCVAGWLEIEALGDALIVIVAPHSPLRAALRRLRTFVRDGIAGGNVCLRCATDKIKRFCMRSAPSSFTAQRTRQPRHNDECFAPDHVFFQRRSTSYAPPESKEADQ